MILSTIIGIESNDITSQLTLDLFMRLERGQNGRWGIVWSKVNEKGPKERGPKGRGGISWSKAFEEDLGQVPNPPPKPNSNYNPKHKTLLKWQPKPSHPTIPLNNYYLTHPHSKHSSQVPPSHPTTSASTSASLVGSDMSEAIFTSTHMASRCTEKLLLVVNFSDASVAGSLCSDAFVDESLCSEGDVA